MKIERNDKICARNYKYLSKTENKVSVLSI